MRMRSFLIRCGRFAWTGCFTLVAAGGLLVGSAAAQTAETEADQEQTQADEQVNETQDEAQNAQEETTEAAEEATDTATQATEDAGQAAQPGEATEDAREEVAEEAAETGEETTAQQRQRQQPQRREAQRREAQRRGQPQRREVYRQDLDQEQPEGTAVDEQETEAMEDEGELRTQDDRQQPTQRDRQLQNQRRRQAQDQRFQDQRFQDQRFQDQRFQQDRRFQQDQRLQDQQRQQLQAREGADLQSTLGIALTADAQGLVVQELAPQSPLANAGLEPGDQIVSIAGRRLTSQADFMRIIAQVDPGQRLPLVILRDGQQEVIYWTPGARIARYGAGFEDVRPGDFGPVDRPPSGPAFLGVRLDERYPNWAVVMQVYENSPAEAVGIRRGDTILAVNGQRIRSAQDLTWTISQMEPGASIQLRVSRPVVRDVEIQLGSRMDQSGAYGEEMQFQPEMRGYRGGEVIEQDMDARDFRARRQFDERYEGPIERGVRDRLFNRR